MGIKIFQMRLKSIILALFVTFLWSTSFVVIKIGLAEIPALTFAGLRYGIAFLCLLPLMFTRKNAAQFRSLTASDWKKLTVLGLLFYTLTQGAQFLGLSLLPAVTVSLILNFTPAVVAVMGIFLISEIPSKMQWLGMSAFIVGVLVYFLPADLSGGTGLGVAVMLFGVLANAGSAVSGRGVNRGHKLSPVVVTVVSMGIGSVILLAGGIIVQGLPEFSWRIIGILAWLAVLNTAAAFTLWNYTLRHLTAVESSIINGTMLIQIAVLAWVFLGESITYKEIAGMVIAGGGALLVQLKGRKRSV